MNLYQTFLKELPHVSALENEPLSKHTSFRVGGPAELFLQPKTEAELAEILRLCRKMKLQPVVLGAGTNVVAPDEGLRGVVICTRDCLAGLRRLSETEIEADCGVPLARLAVFARDRSLTGLEFAHGIPGTVGGGMVMNAGAYGGEMKQVVEQVQILMPDGTLKAFSKDEMEFGYRTSILKTNGGVAVGAVFSLQKEDPAEIAAQMADFANRRRSKQPLEYPSAGSTFKRPEGYFAGKLISDAGLRGFTIGGAQVSDKHAGFVINKNGASAADVRAVIEAVQQKVMETAGVRLEREVIFLGDF